MPLIIILPFIALAVRNEGRMSRLETNVKWIVETMKKNSGCKPAEREGKNATATTTRTIDKAD